MAFAFGTFVPEILAEFNPVTASIIALKDAWQYFEEGKYYVGGFYVTAAIAEFVPWAQIFNKIADVGKITIKAFKYFKSVKVLKIAPEFLLNLDALKYVDELKSEAFLKSDGYTSFSGIKNKWKRDFPETLNADGTSKVFRHHAIEQQVIDKYPGVITLEELHSISNLRGIPNELNSSMHLSNQFLHGNEIKGEWQEFYNKFEDLDRFPTKQELLEKATDIDNKLGHLFYPPIRD